MVVGTATAQTASLFAFSGTPLVNMA